MVYGAAFTKRVWPPQALTRTCRCLPALQCRPSKAQGMRPGTTAMTRWAALAAAGNQLCPYMRTHISTHHIAPRRGSGQMTMRAATMRAQAPGQAAPAPGWRAAAAAVTGVERAALPSPAASTTAGNLGLCDHHGYSAPLGALQGRQSDSRSQCPGPEHFYCKIFRDDDMVGCHDSTGNCYISIIAL